MSRFLFLERTCILIHFFGKLLVYGMRCLLLSNFLNFLRVFSSWNCVLNLFTVHKNVTVGAFMAVIPDSISLRCRLRLGHSFLNLNKHTYRLRSCGASETEEQLLLSCTLHSAFRIDPLQSVELILLKEGLQDLLLSVMCDHAGLLQILLFGNLSLKVKNPLRIYIMLSLMSTVVCTNRFTSPQNHGFLFSHSL